MPWPNTSPSTPAPRKPAEKPPTTPGRLNNPPSDPPVGCDTHVCCPTGSVASAAFDVSPKTPLPAKSLPRRAEPNGKDMNRARLPPNFHSLFRRASAPSAEMSKLMVSATNMAKDRSQDNRNQGCRNDGEN